MKHKILILTISIIFIPLLILSSCGNSTKNNEEVSSAAATVSPDDQENSTKIEIAGVYSGIDNVGMESSIVLRSGGTLIIKASVGDGTPDYGHWTGSSDDLALYHNDAFGNEELIGNAKVTAEGLEIIGGKFYNRQ
jgi:hypothetical protein